MLYDAWWSYYGEFAVLGIWGIILVLARRMIFGKLSKNALLDGGEKSRMIRAMTRCSGYGPDGNSVVRD